MQSCIKLLMIFVIRILLLSTWEKLYIISLFLLMYGALVAFQHGVFFEYLALLQLFAWPYLMLYILAFIFYHIEVRTKWPQFRWHYFQIDRLVQERRNSSVLAMELRLSCLTHRNKFSCKKAVAIWFMCCWNLFLSVQLTISQHWCRWWPCAAQVTSHHYLNHCWPKIYDAICTSRPQCVKMWFDFNMVFIT